MIISDAVKSAKKKGGGETSKKTLFESIITNQGMKEGYCLSPSLFNMYIDCTIKSWEYLVLTDLLIDSKTSITTIQFIDDQTTFSENDLQKTIYKLHHLFKNYNIKISVLIN